MSFNADDNNGYDLLEFLFGVSQQLEDLLDYHGDRLDEYRFGNASHEGGGDDEMMHLSSGLCTSNSGNLYGCHQAPPVVPAQASLTSGHNQASSMNNTSIQPIWDQYNHHDYGDGQDSSAFGVVANTLNLVQGYTSSAASDHQQDYVPTTSTNSTQYSAKQLAHAQEMGYTTTYNLNGTPSHQQLQLQLQLEPAFVSSTQTTPEYKFDCAYCYWLATVGSNFTGLEAHRPEN